ncbi:MAG: hypothetical protein ACKV2V_09215 [Blastocatellia bacterium]
MNDDPTKPMTTDNKLDAILTKMVTMEREFAEFRAFAEPKLYDTKPIWEQALKEIMETRLEMSQRLDRMEKEMRRTRAVIETMAEDLLQARADVRDLNRRVDSLEKDAA